MPGDATQAAGDGQISGKIQTNPPFIAFQPGNVPPSQAIYLQLNDFILLRWVCNQTPFNFTVNYRYLTPQGEIKEGQTILVAGLLVQSFALPLGEAWLL